MSIQTYFCPFHVQMFEVSVPFSMPHPPRRADCPLGEVVTRKDDSALGIGPHTGSWRPSAPNCIVKEGTGAFKRSSINHD